MAKTWSHDEEVLALALYCQIPFGKIHAHNPEVKRLADYLDRTPASVSMKMCNFARFDPALSSRGITGLQNGRILDEQVWNEYHKNWEALVADSEGVAGRLHVPVTLGETDRFSLLVG